MHTISRRSLLQAASVAPAIAALGIGTDVEAASNDLYVIAELVAKPGSEDALRNILVPFAAKARKEPGCRQYLLMEVEKESGRFLTFERWSGHAALDAHMKTPEITAIVPKLEPILVKPFTQTFLGLPKTA